MICGFKLYFYVKTGVLSNYMLKNMYFNISGEVYNYIAYVGHNAIMQIGKQLINDIVWGIVDMYIWKLNL